MVSSISEASKSLDSYFANIVNLQMEAEREQYIARYTTEKQELEVKQAVFTDLNNYITELRDEVQKLITTDTDYIFSSSQIIADVSNQSNSGTVLTAKVDESAIPATYKVEVVNLAKAHTIASDIQTSSSSPLLINGTININGTEIVIGSGDSLIGIATKINEASYDEDMGVTASIVDNRLVIEAEHSGSSYGISMTDVSGSVLETLGILDTGVIKNEIVPATDALFKVNNLEITRSQNSDIDDVIEGVTINLASDAEGESAVINVETDNNAVTTEIKSIANKFNSLIDYILKKTQNTQIDENTVQRGALSGNFTVYSLRSEIIDQLNSSVSGFDDFSMLIDLGIELDEDLHMNISDQSKLESALTENIDSVMEFLSKKMSSLETSLDNYVGSEGIVTYTMTGFTDQIKSLETKIGLEEDRLSRRELMLIDQYTDYQNQLTKLESDLQIIGVLNASLLSNLFNSNNSGSSY